MPRFRTTRIVDRDEVRGTRCLCDGCDPARLTDEHAESASIWIVTAGAFELRDRDGRHVLDPTRALVMPAGHPFTIRHPAGPDTCVSFHGALVDELSERGPRIVPITPAQQARLATALAIAKPGAARIPGPGYPEFGAKPGESGELAFAELVADLAAPRERVREDRDLAGAITHQLHLGFAEPTSLAELVEHTGYSLFHACRVFRATTGTTIHGYRRELRLRHALAGIFDGESLADLAARIGFASQSHLTNLFRARYGITPARARTHDGRRYFETAPSETLRASGSITWRPG